MCVIGAALSSNFHTLGDECGLEFFHEGFLASICGGRVGGALLGFPTYSEGISIEVYIQQWVMCRVFSYDIFYG